MDAETRTRLRNERSRIVRERTASWLEIDFDQEVQTAISYHQRRREGQRRAHRARKTRGAIAVVA